MSNEIPRRLVKVVDNTPALVAPEGLPQPEADVGQIWIARPDEGPDVLVLLTEVRDDHVQALLCSHDDGLATETDAVLEPGLTGYRRRLLVHGDLERHGMYYFVPGMLQHFDTEALFALVAPRPMLQLSGDQDGGAPTDGIEVLEEKLGRKAELNLLPMQAGDVARTEADVEETRAALDYAPSTAVEVGVGNFVDWYLDYYGQKP